MARRCARIGPALALVALLFAAPAAHAASCASVAGNLVRNCSFEQPVVGPGGDDAVAPGSSIGAWTVSQGGDAVDLTDRRLVTVYPVSDGNQSVDLNRDRPGGIEQRLATTAGGAYRLAFDLSGYPSKPAPCPATEPQRISVSAGSSAQTFSFKPNDQATPPGAQRFERHVVDFVGAGNDLLRMRGLNAGCAGPVVDNVVVTQTKPPVAVAGKSMTALTTSGTVLVRQPGKARFERITSFNSLPVGTIVDARHGRVRIYATSGGKTFSADFYEGEFQIAQLAKSGATADLKLFGGNFKGCPKPAKGGAANKAKPIRHLWGSGSGPFRTIGRFASAAVRGTTWLTADQCRATLVRVTAGIVTVRDLVKRRNVVVRAGSRYLAAG